MIEKISIVIPARNETQTILTTLYSIKKYVKTDYEIIVVVDSETDTTFNSISHEIETEMNLTLLVQPYGPGPANAIKYGLESARFKCIIVTMADGSDDAKLIDDLANLIFRGCVIAAGSRYTRGGSQIGGPFIKRTLSRLAGLSLFYLAGVGIKDSTNSFKAFDSEFIKKVGFHSKYGFEFGLEMVAKAHRCNQLIGELPTIWIDRQYGRSNFQIFKWLPKYLYWYRFAFGKKILLSEIVKILDGSKK